MQNQALSLNPLRPSTLSEIDYRSKGIIFSNNPDVDRELNEVLNLNCEERNLIISHGLFNH